MLKSMLWHEGRALGGLVTACALALSVGMTGCMSQSAAVMPSSPSFGRAVTSALLENTPDAARETLADALRSQPQNGYLHLLNGLTYQLEDDSLGSLELATVGYEAAAKFAPGYFWSHYLCGAGAFQRQDYREAAEQFSRAILQEPSRYYGFLGLAAAAYYAGDLGVARAAADRALALAPAEPAVMRAAAYITAARGERKDHETLLAKGAAVPAVASELSLHKGRLAQLLRTAQLELHVPVPPDAAQQSAAPQPDTAAVAVPQPPQGPSQLMVEVTLLLNQNASSRTTGINLLDGLTFQYSLEHTLKNEYATATGTSFARSLISAIKVPQITYSLNLFNSRSDYYQVIARPSLVASLGQQSEFFIGRTVTVGVSGINIGILQPIDVGTSVKITPIEITPERAKFRVEAVRSFFAQESSGTFQQSLTTFKQTVAATCEVQFGHTLILSGLYEAVNVGSHSKTPLVGDVPVLDVFFKTRTDTQRRDAALLLVTPRLPGTVQTDTREFRGETLQKLLALWQDVVDPTSRLDVIMELVRHKMQRYMKAQAGDLKLPPVTAPETMAEVVNETVSRLY